MTPPVCTENCALVDPAAAVTDVGKPKEPAFVALMAMFDPPAGAAADRVIVQVEDACAVRTVELHANPFGVNAVGGVGGGGGASVRVKFCEVEFREAASTAVAFALTLDAFAVKPAEFEPAGTKTEDGIVRLAPEARPVVTVSPPVGAGADNLTVHAADPGVVIVAGKQVSPVAA